MPALPNEKHEAFAQALAKDGESRTAARRYREIIGGNGRNVESSASKLRTRVLPRIAEIRQGLAAMLDTSAKETAKVLAEQFAGQLLTMAERRAFLARVVRADVTRLDTEKDGDLVQEIIINEQGTKLKLPGKRECILLDAELAGELIEKHEVKDVTTRESLEELRKRVGDAMVRHGRS